MKKLILSSLFVLISIVSFSQGFYNRWVPTSGTDTYTTNITSFTSLSNSVIYVKFTNTNTTAATITINGTLGPAPIRAWDGDSWEVLTGGELDVNTIYKLSYQGSYYELEGIGSGGSIFPTTGTGTATGNVTGDLDGNDLAISNIGNLTSTSNYTNIAAGSSQLEIGSSIASLIAPATSGDNYISTETASGIILNTSDANRLVIQEDGGWYLGSTGAGSSGQVLTNNGATSPPSWEDPSGGLESVSVSTSGGTITLDFNSGDNDDAVEKMFIGSATFSSSKAVDFSNSSGKLVFNFHFEITNVAGTITCASCIMSDEDDKWDSGTDTWTPTQTGKYEMGGTWDGSAWKTKIMGPFN